MQSDPKAPSRKIIHAVEVAQFQTISTCNGQCLMCPYGATSRKFPQGSMSWELVERVVRELASVSSLAVIGPTLQNEPLLDDRLERVIRLVKRHRPDVRAAISTNGYLLDAARLRALEEAGLDELTFSLNALTEEVFSVVQPRLDWKTVMTNLSNLIDQRPERISVVVKAKVIRENMVELSAPHRFSDLPDRLEKAGIPFGADAISNRAGTLEGYEDMLVFNRTHSSKESLYCRDPFDSINVLFNGDLLACCSDWSRASVIGNLGRKSLRQIWDGAEARRRRDLVAGGRYRELDPCQNCSQAWTIIENQRTART